MGCVITAEHSRWPGGVVPYTFDEVRLTSDQIAVIKRAIDRWNGLTERTTVELQPRSGQHDFVEFRHGPNCSSDAAGRRRGRRIVNCRATDQSSVEHEIGHVLGLFHEHQRERRDDFVTINLENVQDDARRLFREKPPHTANVGPYDYDSIMHYGERDCAVKWQPEWAIEGIRSKATPAVATFRDELHMVHLGESTNNIWHARSTDGVHWTQDSLPISGQKSKASPALASFGDELHMVHLGAASNNIWHSWTTDGRNWERQQIRGQKSKATPGLLTFENKLHLVHVGDWTDALWYTWSTDGREWADNRPLAPEHRSNMSPTMLSDAGSLVMVYLGYRLDGLWQSQLQGGSWSSPLPVSREYIRLPVGMAWSAASGSHLVHVRRHSSNVWHSRFDPLGGWEEPETDLNARTNSAPALATLVEDVYLFHLGPRGHSVYQTQFDDTLRTIVPPSGVRIGSGTISRGDIQTVAQIYQ